MRGYYRKLFANLTEDERVVNKKLKASKGQA